MTRYKFLLYFFFLFLFVSFFVRIVLLAYSFTNIDTDIIVLFKLFAIGFLYDTVAYFYYIIPFVIYLFLIPSKLFNSKIHKIISLLIFFTVIYGVVFNGFSEWFFWNEFGKRFNFIAVDYLVYTHEVIKNIQESYPMPLLIGTIFIITVTIFYFIAKKSTLFNEIFQDKSSYKNRFVITLLLLCIPLIAFALLEKQTLVNGVSSNRYNQEIAKNGFYSLFSAFRNNQLDYDEFYKTEETSKVLMTYRNLVKSSNSKFLSNDLNNSLRFIESVKDEKKYNVMLVMIESLSASYMGAYGDERGLTPHIDRLTKNALFFSNFFATGTRTVRGMEAVTMSVPPTAGRSIVKRPDNHNMFGMGWTFKEKGYDNKFIYAGHGYFDNMNEYFSHNGFKVVDRRSFEEHEVTFANVWGVCDEDLFDKAINEADESYVAEQPFFSFIMTTSNHRPYTYPDGKIDIPSHTGRAGGVKYTDYSVNRFIEKASEKPWFKNTLFIFVADHNGGSAGKNALPLYRYKIPFLIYAPDIIVPKEVKKLSSQIDLAPTLFALMNWSYKSKFYGKDILSKDFYPRALIGNYQKLGLYQENKLTMLLPDASVKEFRVESLKLKSNEYREIEPLSKDIEETIGYYQSANYFYKNHLDRYEIF
jgi:phosphoglycerol transferase MdoB-like AlkP superfamily enzyme